MCEQNEYCEFGHLIKFDKDIITSGFNIFLFLFQYKEVNPDCLDLNDFDYRFKNENTYQAMSKIYKKDA